jgi:hypothetical protein
MKKFTTSILALAAAMLTAVSAHAGDNVWSTYKIDRSY